MIIFDLDGTLADCEHRSHFVDIRKSFSEGFLQAYEVFGDKVTMEQRGHTYHPITHKRWTPDWKSFYEACDKDEPIWPVFRCMFKLDTPYEIWSGRCESVRTKTEDWLFQFMARSEMPDIKMRPIGDNTPDDQLKERWLDEYVENMWPKLPMPSKDTTNETFYRKERIQFVFDSHPKSIAMWRRRGIFVFDVNQENPLRNE